MDRYLSEVSLSVVADLVNNCLSELELPKSEVAHIALPNLGEGILEATYLPALGISIEQTLGSFGKTIGHICSADAIIGLAEPNRPNVHNKGEIILVVSAEASFS